MNLEDLITDAVAFGDHVLGSLGYNEVRFRMIEARSLDDISAHFYVEDDFQERIDYKHRVQHDFLSFDLEKMRKPSKLLSREQRELSAMLSQQGESTALFDLMVSAAGRQFAQALVAERSKYAKLCDLRDAS